MEGAAKGLLVEGAATDLLDGSYELAYTLQTTGAYMLSATARRLRRTSRKFSEKKRNSDECHLRMMLI